MICIYLLMPLCDLRHCKWAALAKVMSWRQATTNIKHDRGPWRCTRSSDHSAWRVSFNYVMMTSSNGNIFRITGHLYGKIHRSPVNSPHNDQWRWLLMLSLICGWINGWANIREAGDLKIHRAHYDVIVMFLLKWWLTMITWKAFTRLILVSNETYYKISVSISCNMWCHYTSKWKNMIFIKLVT